MRLRRIVITAFVALALCATACGISSIGGIEPAEVLPSRDASTSDRKAPAAKDTGAAEEEEEEEEPPPPPPPKDSGTDAKPPVDAAPDTSTPVTCNDPGGALFNTNGHCYFPISPSNEHAAQNTACTNAGGHLATATTSAERDFIKTIGTGDRWIGFTRTAGSPLDKASFSWVTGETPVPDFWKSGEPNGSGSLCGVINGNGEWEDRLCTGNNYNAVCERE